MALFYRRPGSILGRNMSVLYWEQGPFLKQPGWQEEGLGTNPKALTPGIDAWCRSHKIKDAEKEKGWVGGFL